LIAKSPAERPDSLVAIEALEGLAVEQHVSWKKAVERIKRLLEE
jgi:hypothetical protein